MLKESIVFGLLNGYVIIINNPNDGCITCQIGNCWFYFIDTKYKSLTVTEIHDIFTNDEIANMICATLKDMEVNGFYEVQYYKQFLNECKKWKN